MRTKCFPTKTRILEGNEIDGLKSPAASIKFLSSYHMGALGKSHNREDWGRSSKKIEYR